MYELKQLLLNYELVIDNEFLDAYVKLIEANKTTEKNKGTQVHHVIPVVYYKHKFNLKLKTRSRSQAEAYAFADKNNFLVNLKYVDHMLAHCYLALCSKEDWFKFANANMITAAKKDLTIEEFAQLSNRAEYQLAYEKLMEQKHGRKLSEETKAKIAKAHLSENMSAEYHKKLSDANRRRVITSETREKLRIASSKHKAAFIARTKLNPPTKGTKWVHKDTVAIRVAEDKLAIFLENGWQLGNIASKNTVWINNGVNSKMVSKSQLADYLTSGWIIGRLKFLDTTNFGKSSRKRVYCKELNKTFESAAAAAREVEYSSSYIAACCRGEQKSTGGYHWEYINDKDIC